MMMLPYLPRFLVWPLWKRVLIPLGFTLAYVVMFYLLYPLIGGVAVVISFLPVAVVSWTMGREAGIAAGALAVLGNFLLLTFVGANAESVFIRGGLSSLTLILLGGLAGWVSQIVEQQRNYAHQLELDREALRHEMAVRMHKERELEAALAEKEVLLKEIHHRVKNNLQIISSLLSLQSSRLHDPFALTQFQDSQDRIRSMALIHESLYRSRGLARIEFGSYLRDLTGHLLLSYRAQPNSISLTATAPEVYLDIDLAIPCGLLVNELVSNALKHAFPDGRSGEIRVEIRDDDNEHYRLIVQDNGIGFPDGVDFRKTGSLGLQLVNSLTRQLGGRIELGVGAGTTFMIRFPISGRSEIIQGEHLP